MSADQDPFDYGYGPRESDSGRDVVDAGRTPSHHDDHGHGHGGGHGHGHGHGHGDGILDRTRDLVRPV
jgi:hypothetical protein